MITPPNILPSSAPSRVCAAEWPVSGSILVVDLLVAVLLSIVLVSLLLSVILLT